MSSLSILFRSFSSSSLVVSRCLTWPIVPLSVLGHSHRENKGQMWCSRFEYGLSLQDASIGKRKVSPFSIETSFALTILEYEHIQSEAGSNRSSSPHSSLVRNDQSVRENIPGIGTLLRGNIPMRFQSFTFAEAINAFPLGNTVEKVNHWNLSGIFLLERVPIPGMFSLTDWS